MGQETREENSHTAQILRSKEIAETLNTSLEQIQTSSSRIAILYFDPMYLPKYLEFLSLHSLTIIQFLPIGGGMIVSGVRFSNWRSTSSGGRILILTDPTAA